MCCNDLARWIEELPAAHHPLRADDENVMIQRERRKLVVAPRRQNNRPRLPWIFLSAAQPSFAKTTTVFYALQRPFRLRDRFTMLNDGLGLEAWVFIAQVPGHLTGELALL